MEKQQMLIIPIIDTCGGMSHDGNIHKVNDMMRKMPTQLGDIEKQTDTEFLLAPIVFNSGAKWQGLSNGQPARVSEFVWEDVRASGGADLASAYAILREKLTFKEKGGWMEKGKFVQPILLLILDEEPYFGWETNLCELKKKGWFKVAIKIGVDVRSAGCPELKAFTEDEESIFGIDVCEDGRIFELIRSIATPIRWVSPTQEDLERADKDVGFDDFF